MSWTMRGHLIQAIIGRNKDARQGEKEKQFKQSISGVRTRGAQRGKHGRSGVFESLLGQVLTGDPTEPIWS